MLLLSSAASQNPDGRDQVLVDPYLAVGEHMHPALGPRSRAPVVRVRQLLGHDDENLSSFAVASAAIVAETIGPGELAGLDGLRDHVVGRWIRVVGLAPAIEENLGPLRESKVHIVSDFGQHRHGPSRLVLEHQNVAGLPNPAFLRMKEPSFLGLDVDVATVPVILYDWRETGIFDVNDGARRCRPAEHRRKQIMPGHVTVEMTVQNLFVTDLAALYVLFKEQSAQVPVLVGLYLVYSDAFEAETAVKELADTIVLLFDEKDVWPHFCAIYLHCIVYFFIICNLTSISFRTHGFGVYKVKPG